VWEARDEQGYKAAVEIDNLVVCASVPEAVITTMGGHLSRIWAARSGPFTEPGIAMSVNRMLISVYWYTHDKNSESRTTQKFLKCFPIKI